ncbi:preprotein translocase subunit SecD [Halogeometricum borinquense]|uniref:Protein-export membrane protein SecD n=1 Tax=Halogeometricum borinquense TaxID=60847 RepID=A0A6C0UJZ8_9EURY|nr:preprotein translocase subunit SecD [Halogeometricum borinquense]QIB75854.1 preprotein translocase subunit SecD [Halogeometricum borinquense]QIQ75562.1 preprotein translocase subunit SecD [Halogeometricum borinquense]
MGRLRDNWRVLLLVVFLLVSTFALFSPTLASDSANAAPGNATATGPTNLKFGLELSGGTRITAPLVGLTAENVQFNDDDPRVVEQNVAAELEGATSSDVTARLSANASTVEVTAENITEQEFRSALDASGYQYETVREGVTEATREEVVGVLNDKINQAGLSGGSAQQVTTATGQHFIRVEAPNRDTSEVQKLVSERGTVVVKAYYPVEQNSSTTYKSKIVLEREDFQDIGTAQETQSGPAVPVTVKESVAPEFQQTMVDTRVARPGGSRCDYDKNPNSTESCLLVVVDGEVVNSFGMAGRLAGSMQRGEWAKDPGFQLQTLSMSEAQQVAINLRAGALPAKLDLSGEDGGTTSYISSGQGASFKIDSLITGIIAVLAVSGVVFVRYSDVKVAAPMIVTALSEVVILLGFAAAIGYPLDLSVIAGFIAVIGTGVDDLIIIADEVMAEGDVSSRRVFKSRFRKAFRVIGAAAVTTIIAMSPLAVLSLGDLQGFAIFTILGVLVGVLITRPAYGDILRALTTNDR